MKKNKIPCIWTLEGLRLLKLKLFVQISIIILVVIIAVQFALNLVYKGTTVPEFASFGHYIMPIIIFALLYSVTLNFIIKLFIRNKPLKIDNPSKLQVAKINGDYARFLTEIDDVQYWLSIDHPEETTLKKALKRANLKGANLGNNIIWNYILTNFKELGICFWFNEDYIYLVNQHKDKPIINCANFQTTSIKPSILAHQKAHALYFFEVQ